MTIDNCLLEKSRVRKCVHVFNFYISFGSYCRLCLGGSSKNDKEKNETSEMDEGKRMSKNRKKIQCTHSSPLFLLTTVKVTTATLKKRVFVGELNCTLSG